MCKLEIWYDRLSECERKAFFQIEGVLEKGKNIEKCTGRVHDEGTFSR